jgi:ubiquinone/menaquinone biosynthesis C-methylase UbiE
MHGDEPLVAESRTVRDELLEWADARVGALARGRVLDAGCGEGRFLREGWIGADIAADVLPIARLRSTRVCRADARALPFADATFDTALALRMLNATGDVDGALRELRRVLRTDGTLLVLTRATQAPSALRRIHEELTRSNGRSADRLDAENGEARLRRFFAHVSVEQVARRFRFDDAAAALDHYARTYLHRPHRDPASTAALFERVRERVLAAPLPLDDEDRLALFVARG